MKKIIILICSVFCILLSLNFAGCGTARPYKVEWHLSSYFIDAENSYRSVGFDYYDHFSSAFSDSAQISFKDDGGFYFKDKDGKEYSGTYKAQKHRYEAEVILTFFDGSEYTGYYSKSNNYSALFEIAGVNYYFDDRERNFDKDGFDKCLKNLAAAIRTYSEGGKMQIEHYPYYDSLHRAEIGKVGDKLVAVTENNSYLLDNFKYWCYTVGGEVISVTELKEGDCIIRTGYGSLAIYYL